MRIKHLKIRGFRGFNEEQPIDLSDPVSVFEGPNGSGKTSMGEAIEWLLYGKTLKRTKGEELSKREYAGCYKNIHFIGPGSAFVEADIEHSDGTSHVIRRELNSDESSVLQIDGKPAESLRAFGVDTMYDRPLILQHTLQDFIFMKPKGRYEVLSSMLGLEPLIVFRNTLEAAKTDFSRRIPQKVREAESQRTLLLKEMRLEPVLVPAAILVEAANLADAKKHMLQVAQGLVPAGTEATDLPAGLKAAKASKERTQLDWGRFSISVITDPANTPAIRQLTALDDRLKKLRVHLAEAAETTAQAQPSAREPDGNRRQFYRLGLAFLSETHPANNCPFCAADSLTPERAARLRSAVQDSPAGISALQQAVLEVRAFDTELKTHGSEVRRLIPKRPETADEQIITRIGGTAAEAFLESSRAVAAQIAELSQASDSLNAVRSAIEAALTTGTLPNDSDDFSDRLNAYATATRQLPGLLNGYAANYGILDPTIRAGLASASDVKKIERTVQVIERWREFEIAQEYRAVEAEFQELIRETRSFTETKQKSVLASRDKEIRDWYAMLNPVSDVGYDGIITSTDNLELRARTYSKPMMAAPNLSTSQLNCIGLAVYLACATRSGSPFKTLIIDDPVQSMDEEHNEAFKKQVIEKLVDMGYHIVLLTHMQLLAGDVESLYRNKGAALFKMRPYTRTGPSIEWKGPGIGRLLENVKAHKDAENDQYRMSATLDLRKFVERFAKELFKAQTCQLVSKRYEDKTWSELKELLKRCKDFDPNDEPKLADTHSFTSRFLHSDERMPQDVPNSAQVNSHYLAMSSLLERYNTILGFQVSRAAPPASRYSARAAQCFSHKQGSRKLGYPEPVENILHLGEFRKEHQSPIAARAHGDRAVRSPVLGARYRSIRASAWRLQTRRAAWHCPETNEDEPRATSLSGHPAAVPPCLESNVRWQQRHQGPHPRSVDHPR